MMDYIIFVKCFLVGITASCAVGPVFILTFNRGALHDFTHGAATALGSACADGTYFSLGLVGALTLLESSKQFIIAMDLIGGVILFALGIHMFRERKKRMQALGPKKSTLLKNFAQGFLLTISNPFVALFFMFISIQILPDDVVSLPPLLVLTCSIIAALGTLCILSCVALVGSFIGKGIRKKWLKTISLATGCFFIAGGFYFLGDLAYNLFIK